MHLFRPSLGMIERLSSDVIPAYALFVVAAVLVLRYFRAAAGVLRRKNLRDGPGLTSSTRGWVNSATCERLFVLWNACERLPAETLDRESSWAACQITRRLDFGRLQRPELGREAAHSASS